MRIPVDIRRFRRRRHGRARLPFSRATNLRVAQISATAPFEIGRCFSSDQWSELESFRPQVLIGTGADLDRIIKRVLLGTLELSSVDHVVFAITECGDPPVANAFRHVIWENLGVPTYEVFTGPKGKLLASECQAGNGWHLEDGVEFSLVEDELVFESSSQKRLRSGLAGILTNENCECGRKGPRLISVNLRSGIEKSPLETPPAEARNFGGLIPDGKSSNVDATSSFIRASGTDHIRLARFPVN